MHQYKTVAHILLILSIFNLVFAIPVVREIGDAHDDLMVSVVVRSVAATSKERREEDPDGMPSHSSPLPDGSTPSPPPPDGSTPSHSSPPLQNGSPSDGAALLHESPPPPPGGPAALAVSPPPGETAPLPVPASGRPVPSQHTAITHDTLALDPALAEKERRLKNIKLMGVVLAADVAVAAIGGGLLWHSIHQSQRRTIDPDRYVFNPSHFSCRRMSRITNT
jgi:hypothetical protein